jgi:CRISPR-associated protein Cmr3
MAYMKIKPTDSLFFGSGKPFNAGADSWTDSSFLPNPSVIWGALFSVLYREGEIDIVDGKVSEDERKKLKIKNIYLYIEENKVLKFLVPTPLDVYIGKQNNYISELQKVNFISNYPLDYISMIDKDDIEIAENSLIEIGSLFKSYQKHIVSSIYQFDKIFKADYKIGIKIDKDKKTAQENHLYRIDLTQFEKNSGFLVEYEIDEKKSFNPSGVLKLGGEGKSAKYEDIKANRILRELDKYRKKAMDKIEKEKFFKLYFKTATLFKNSWWEKNSIKGLTLLSANVGKYIPIGGFDMEKNKPKAMRRFIPAGSVFVYKIEDESINIRETIENEIKFDESYKGFGLFEILSVKEKIYE